VLTEYLHLAKTQEVEALQLHPHVPTATSGRALPDIQPLILRELNLEGGFAYVSLERVLSQES
jgi:hypothetical protein